MSVGHAALMGGGAYTVAILAERLRLGFWVVDAVRDDRLGGGRRLARSCFAASRRAITSSSSPSRSAGFSPSS